MARAVGITICWAIVLVGSTWAQPAGKNVSVAFLETWEKAAKEPSKSASLWQKFSKRNDAHDLGQLAKLLVGVELLRRSDDRTDLSKLLPYFKLELPAKLDTPDNPEPSYLRKQLAAAGKGVTAHIQMLQLGQNCKNIIASMWNTPRRWMN